jgi:hypothetical protein
MPSPAKTLWLQDFKGLNDANSPGQPPTHTPDELNVKHRFGHVIARGGLTKYLGISTASDTTPIIGLFHYAKASGTNLLVRMTPTKARVLNTGSVAWDDITGTDLTGASTTRPQFTIIDDTLVFTNEGEDLPRKYAGTGNTSSIASGTSPYAKCIESYLGFLFLGNVSDSGAFTDVFDGHRIIRYSDDWDNDWSLCEGNELTLDETPGNLVAMKRLGRDLICYKDDGLVKVRFIGGQVRFQQEKIAVDTGCIAPLSVAAVADAAHVFLGSDAVLYLVTPQEVKPISYEHLSNTLPPTFSLGKLKYARAVVDSVADTYYLLYDRTGQSGQFLDSYVAYNFRSGEFSRGRMGTTVIAAVEHRPTALVSPTVLLSTSTLVEEFDVGSDDDGTSISRYVTTNWQGLGEEGILQGARLVFKKVPAGTIRVSVARDFSETFEFPQHFHLKGGATDDLYTEIFYRVPNLYADWFNLKVSLHPSTTGEISLRRIGLEIIPVHDDRNLPERGGSKAAVV